MHLLVIEDERALCEQGIPAMLAAEVKLCVG